MKRLRNAWGAPRRAREPVCFHHKTPNAHREQLYGSPKAATQPSRLRSADGAFWGVLARRYYRFVLVWDDLETHEFPKISPFPIENFADQPEVCCDKNALLPNNDLSNNFFELWKWVCRVQLEFGESELYLDALMLKYFSR